jgi:hypothetical protein
MTQSIFKLSLLVLVFGLSSQGYAQQSEYPLQTQPQLNTNTPTVKEWRYLRLSRLLDQAQELEIYPVLAKPAISIDKRIKEESLIENNLRNDWFKNIATLRTLTKSNMNLPTSPQRSWHRISDLETHLRNLSISDKKLADQRGVLLAQIAAENLREYEIRRAFMIEIKALQSEVTAAGAMLEERAAPIPRKTDTH